MNVPRETLQRDIGRERVDTLITMKSHASESETIECDIQQLQAKLDGVEHENTRCFHTHTHMIVQSILRWTVSSFMSKEL
jgi:hypothetical protein